MNALSPSIPALLYTMSGTPSFSTVAATIACASSFFETSAPSAIALPPAVSMSRAVWAAARWSISTTATFAPSSANSSEPARPIPEPAPVISATLLASFMRPLPRDSLAQIRSAQ